MCLCFINRRRRVLPYERVKNELFCTNSTTRRRPICLIFKLCPILNEMKNYWNFKRYFWKYFTIEVIWAKYEEIRNFTILHSSTLKSASTKGPGSMKLGQFEGFHPKLLQNKFKEIWSKPGGSWPAPYFFIFFFNKSE